jgi:tetratricopeptide (TPR) repeat protein
MRNTQVPASVVNRKETPTMRIRFALLLTLFAGMVYAGSLDDAKALVDKGEYEKARPILENALEDSSSEAEAALLLTRICNAQGDWAAGVKYGKRAAKLLSSRSEAHYEYAVALRTKMSSVSKVKAMFALGTYKDELKRAIELDPTNTDAISERIGFLTNAPGIAGGDLDEAERENRTLEKIDWLLAKQMQVEIELAREDLPAAIRVYEEILEKHPDQTGTQLSLGILLQRNGQYQDADLLYSQLTEHEDRQVALIALYQRGRTRILGEFELEEAITMLESFIKELGQGSSQLPTESNALWRIGNAYEKLGNIARARSTYEKALTLEPDAEYVKDSLKTLKD